jgi:hypothetical protein
VVIGTLSILTHPGKVLFDTGATTSFISKDFVEKYGLRCQAIAHPMMVVTARGKLLVSQFKPNQVITICDCPYFTDLYVLPLKTLKLFWVWIGCPIMEHTLIVKRRECLSGSLEVGESPIKQISTPMWRLEFNSIL